MESYPNDLHEGVVPLVYVVNAIDDNYHSSPTRLFHDDRQSIVDDDGVGVGGVGIPASTAAGNSTVKQQGVVQTTTNTSSTSNMFDAFLDTLKGTVVALSSSQDSNNNNNNMKPQGTFSMDSAESSEMLENITGLGGTSSSYESMRFVPVSKRHAFPPSKDPTGTNNLSRKSGTMMMSGSTQKQRLSSSSATSSNPQQQQQQYPTSTTSSPSGQGQSPINDPGPFLNQPVTNSDVVVQSSSVSSTTAPGVASSSSTSQFGTQAVIDDPLRNITAEELFSLPPPGSSAASTTTHVTTFTGESNPTATTTSSKNEGNHPSDSGFSLKPPQQEQQQAKQQQPQRQDDYPGILPKDWLEKHAQWLPSVVMMVCVLDLNLPQAQRTKRDEEISELVDIIRTSLAPKRECRLHLVCLVINHEHLKSAQQKYHIESGHLTNLRGMARLAPSSVSLVHVPTPTSSFDVGRLHQLTISKSTEEDLMFDLYASSPCMMQLTRTIRNMSMAYYLASARRMKHKLSTLHEAFGGVSSAGESSSSSTMAAATTMSSIHTAMNHHLLPLAIRYHFKIAIYYEFQMKLDKSQRHLQEAYQCVELYYRFIVNQQRHIMLSEKASSQSKKQNKYQQQQNEKQSYVTDVGGATTTTGTTVNVSPSSSPRPRGTYVDLPPPMSSSVVESPTTIQPNMTIQSNESEGDEGGVEVSLSSPPLPSSSTPLSSSRRQGSTTMSTTMDVEFVTSMAHQCRGVASWIHLKLMLYNFQRQQAYAEMLRQESQQQQSSSSSLSPEMESLLFNEDSPLALASSQWRRHCQTFLSLTYYYYTDRDDQICLPLSMKKNTSSSSSTSSSITTFLQPLWLHWTHVSHQRSVMAQIATAYHIPELAGSRITNGPSGEVLMTCNPWRLSESAAEATLQLSLELRKVVQTLSSSSLEYSNVDSMRTTLVSIKVDGGGTNRYVGNYDIDRLRQTLGQELNKHHDQLAIDHLEKAISTFYLECQSFVQEDDGNNGTGSTTWTTPTDPPRKRLISKSHYLAGHLYMMPQGDPISSTSTNYIKARQHLVQALNQTNRWPSMEVQLGCSLAKCVVEDPTFNNGSALRSAGSTNKLVMDQHQMDVILKSFMKLMLRVDTSELLTTMKLKQMTDAFVQLWSYSTSMSSSSSSSSRIGSSTATSAIHVKWPEVLHNVSPFSFEWVFLEESGFATAGDTIRGCLFVTSHVKYPMKVTQMQIMMNSSIFNGHPIDVFLPQGGVIIPPSSSSSHYGGRETNNDCHPPMAFEVTIDLPTVSDLPPMMPNATTTTTTWANRPVSYREVTVALCPMFLQKKHEDNNDDLVNHSLLSFRLTFPCRRNVVRQKARFAQFVLNNTSNQTNHSTTTADTGSPTAGGNSTTGTAMTEAVQGTMKKRYEDDNYVMNAGVQNGDDPHFIGAMCLQLANPRPYVCLENVSSKILFGNNNATPYKAMDGTINRVAFRLTSATDETCQNVRLQFTSFSNHCPSSSSSREAMIVMEKNVKTSSKSTTMNITNQSHNNGLPVGWIERSMETETLICETLNPCQSKLFYIDFYRPAAASSSPEEEEPVEPDTLLVDKCFSQYTFQIKYDQIRASATCSSTSTTVGKTIPQPQGDTVTYMYSDQIEWFSPVKVEFVKSSNVNASFPCGSQMSSNQLGTTETTQHPPSTVDDASSATGGTIRAVCNESITMKCHVTAYDEEALVPNILTINYREPRTTSSEWSMHGTISCTNTGNQQDDGSNPQTADSYVDPVCRNLDIGSRLAMSFDIKVSSDKPYVESNATSTASTEGVPPPLESNTIEIPLGSVSIHWTPKQLCLNDEITRSTQSDKGDVTDKSTNASPFYHGPLQLPGPHNVLKVRAPQAKVEIVPFVAGTKHFTTSCHVAVPFDVTYWVTNRTPLNQKLSILVDDSLRGTELGGDGWDGSSSNPAISGDVLVSGLVSGHILVGPYETTTFGYTAVALRAGRTRLPMMNVSCERYNSWIIRENMSSCLEVYVLP